MKSLAILVTWWHKVRGLWFFMPLCTQIFWLQGSGFNESLMNGQFDFLHGIGLSDTRIGDAIQCV